MSQTVATEISRALAPWLELDIEAVEGATEVEAAWSIVPDLEPTPTWTFAILHRVLRAAHVAPQGLSGSEQTGGAPEVVASFRWGTVGRATCA